MILQRDRKLSCWRLKNTDGLDFIYTLLDRTEMAMIDNNKKIVYFNSLYKDKFPTLRKQIQRLYKDFEFSEYCNMI